MIIKSKDSSTPNSKSRPAKNQVNPLIKKIRDKDSCGRIVNFIQPRLVHSL
jgi:hypothetical protein